MFLSHFLEWTHKKCCSSAILGPLFDTSFPISAHVPESRLAPTNISNSTQLTLLWTSSLADGRSCQHGSSKSQRSNQSAEQRLQLANNACRIDAFDFARLLSHSYLKQLGHSGHWSRRSFQFSQFLLCLLLKIVQAFPIAEAGNSLDFTKQLNSLWNSGQRLIQQYVPESHQEHQHGLRFCTLHHMLDGVHDL